MRGVIVNSGISNACTGERGMRDAEAMTRAAEEAAGANQGEFLVASTGVIGQYLPIKLIQQETPRLIESLSPSGWRHFARAIMTTDTVPKLARRTLGVSPGAGRGSRATILGVAKGVGMLEPKMATMLAFVATDYPLASAQARRLVRRVADGSFNCVTVDGDTSTSDTFVLMANGAALSRRDADPTLDTAFETALTEVCQELCRAIARDGEGAKHLITIEVGGARNGDEARAVAKSIANSNLVKTAVFGHDPNWGRICMAAGNAGAPFKPEEFSVRIQGKTVLNRGLPARFSRPALVRALNRDEVLIQVGIGNGNGRARVWTCDMTHDYIRINAEYTT